MNWLIAFRHQCGVPGDPIKREKRERYTRFLKYRTDVGGSCYMGGPKSAQRFSDDEIKQVLQELFDEDEGCAGGSDWLGWNSALFAVPEDVALRCDTGHDLTDEADQHFIHPCSTATPVPSA